MISIRACEMEATVIVLQRDGDVTSEAVQVELDKDTHRTAPARLHHHREDLGMFNQDNRRGQGREILPGGDSSARSGGWCGSVYCS